MALQRGPIVYAAEWPDNPNGQVRNIVLPDVGALTSEFRGDLLNGVQVVRGRAVGLALRRAGRRAADRAAVHGHSLRARGPTADAGRWRCGWPGPTRPRAPTPFPTIATSAAIAASPIPSGRGKNARNIIDGDEPAGSADSTSYFDWWPVQGSAAEWVEMTFAKPATVSSTRGLLVRRHRPGRRPRAGLVAPALQDGDRWLPVDAARRLRHGAERVEHARLRAGHDHRAPDRGGHAAGFSAGVQEWKVK